MVLVDIDGRPPLAWLNNDSGSYRPSTADPSSGFPAGTGTGTDHTPEDPTWVQPVTWDAPEITG
jgi:hypothetical protein